MLKYFAINLQISGDKKKTWKEKSHFDIKCVDFDDLKGTFFTLCPPLHAAKRHVTKMENKKQEKFYSIKRK